MNDEWLKRYIDAINAHDYEAIVSCMTEDAVFEDVALGEQHRGHEAIKAFFANAESELSSDYQLADVTGFVGDDRYALEWVFTGTHDRSAPQLPATGKQFACRGASVGRRESGKIKENRDYWNMVEFLTQVGIMPAPEA